MNTHSSTKTELALIQLSLKIGSIAETNANFTRGLAQYIDSLEKPLSALTVVELAALVDDYREAFNYPDQLPPKKTSRAVIAKNITFEQAQQFHNCIVKFSCMSAPGEEVAL